MIKRKNAIYMAVFFWFLIEVANWSLNNLLSSSINAENVGWVLAYLKPKIDYLSNGFTFGFVIGGTLFSIWDWPLLGAWLRKLRVRMRNKEADEALANECEELSQKLHESSVHIEQLRNENHQQLPQNRNIEEIQKSWRDGQAAVAREEDRIRIKYSYQVNQLIVKLRSHGIKMDLWSFSLSYCDLASSSYFLLDIAHSLRDGTYLEREFTASRAGLPAHM